MQRDIEGVLISEEEIERHVAEIGKRISADFEGKDRRSFEGLLYIHG